MKLNEKYLYQYLWLCALLLGGFGQGVSIFIPVNLNPRNIISRNRIPRHVYFGAFDRRIKFSGKFRSFPKILLVVQHPAAVGGGRQWSDDGRQWSGGGRWWSDDSRQWSSDGRRWSGGGLAMVGGGRRWSGGGQWWRVAAEGNRWWVAIGVI